MDSANATAATTVSEGSGAWGHQLGHGPSAPTWIWDGLVAAGNITLFTAQWKSGKTTLLSHLLARMKQGGRVAGLPVAAGKAIVLTEESRELWQARHERHDLGHVFFLGSPFRGKPSQGEWLHFIERVGTLCRTSSMSLLAIDTLMTFLPGRDESSAAPVVNALLPLRRLTEAGLAVLLCHHPAKGVTAEGQAARGSGALAAFTDINLEMSVLGDDPAGRRRRILGFSRHERTPRQFIIELDATGADYREVPEAELIPDDFAENWACLRMVLEDADNAKTRRELLREWPEDFHRPSDATLYRWLQRAEAAGFVCHAGTGRRNEPFRYWLRGREPELRRNPLFALDEMIRDKQGPFSLPQS